MNDNTMFLKPTCTFKIFKTIMQLKDKSGEVDGTSAKVLQLIAHYTSTWPEALKIAEVSFKNGDKPLTTYYRPKYLILNKAKFSKSALTGYIILLQNAI